MIIDENCSLKGYNTFGIDVKTRFLAELDSAEEFRLLLSVPPFNRLPLLVLGGGSNILLTGDFKGLAILNCIRGIRKIREDDLSVWVEAGAGEVWQDLVDYCIDNNLAGIENLSLIPGSVGAGPMQNIGAYGVEIKDVFEELEAFEIFTAELRTFSKEDCRFGYRDSYFKQEGKGRYVITRVTLRLNKKPILNTSYGAIQDELNKAGIVAPSIKEVSEAVCRIRRSKLPDPKVTGNAGSFFKNPVVSKQVCKELKNKFPDIVTYPQPDGSAKLAAGWLIDQCGWKGYRKGDAGVHPQQALVLVNYGKATGAEIVKLSNEVSASVKNKFNIELEREVNLI